MKYDYCNDLAANFMRNYDIKDFVVFERENLV